MIAEGIGRVARSAQKVLGAVSGIGEPLDATTRFDRFASIAATLGPLLPTRRGLEPDGAGFVLATLVDRALTRGLPVELRTQVHGLAEVRRALDHGVGVLMCSCHLYLNPILRRVLHDAGLPALLIARSTGARANDPRPIWGVDASIESVPNDARSLLRARSALRRGMIVLTDIDVPGPTSQTIALPRRPRVHVRPTVFRFARTVGVPLLFFAARFARRARAIEVRFGGPGELSAGDDVEALIESFDAFLHG